MRRSKRAVTALAAAGLLLATLAPGVAVASDGPGGNVDDGACTALGFDWQEKWEYHSDSSTYTRSGSSAYLTSVTGNDLGGSFTAAEGYLVGHVFVKGGDDHDGGRGITPPAATGSFDNSNVPNAGQSGSPAGISNVVFCGNDKPEPDPDPEYFVAFTKTWTGDDIGLGDHDVTFRIKGLGDWNIGDKPAAVQLGQSLDVKEIVTGLPDNCDYTSDLDSPVVVPNEGKDGQIFTIDVTNHVDCTEVLSTYNVSFTKKWTGDVDEAKIDGVTVAFEVSIDGKNHTLEDGEIVIVEGDIEKANVELLDEVVTGLPDTCAWKFAGTELADDDNVDVTVTNTVHCDEPKDDPEFYNVSFTKNWTGDVAEAKIDGVTVAFEVSIDGKNHTLEDGEIVIVEGDIEKANVELLDEVVTGLPDTCAWKFAGTELADDDNVEVTVTNTLDCDEADEVAIVHPKPDVTEKTPAPPTEVKVVTRTADPKPELTTAPAAEVKGVTLTADPKPLPRTGASALLLALSAMGAMGTGGLMVRRRP
jgi:hypothetical protein